jgi:hypothetical protein
MLIPNAHENNSNAVDLFLNLAKHYIQDRLVKVKHQVSAVLEDKVDVIHLLHTARL